MKEELKHISYTNAEEFVRKDGKVVIGKGVFNNEDYLLELSIISDNHEPRALHTVKDNIVTTAIRISPESALCIMQGLQRFLTEDGFSLE